MLDSCAWHLRDLETHSNRARNCHEVYTCGAADFRQGVAEEHILNPPIAYSSPGNALTMSQRTPRLSMSKRTLQAVYSYCSGYLPSALFYRRQRDNFRRRALRAGVRAVTIAEIYGEE